MKRKIKRKFGLAFRIFILIFFFLLITLFIKKNAVIGIKYLAGIISSSDKNEEIIKPYTKEFSVVELEKKLRESNIPDFTVSDRSNQGEVYVVIKNGPVVIFSTNKNLEWQITSLQDIITRLTIENKKPKKIDFTFEKTIVNF